MLDVGDGQRIHWSVSGAPDGIPVVCLHGGPGGGSSPNNSRLFDPAVFRTVTFDQRGCGRSTPHVSDPAVSLETNTTWHSVEDIERLRAHLGVERWLVYGGSWGSTLGLAYAQRHPERVAGMLLVAVTTTSRSEIEWLYRGAGRFRPAEWDAFRRGAGVTEPHPDVFDLITAYQRLIGDPDETVRDHAARDWCTWEDALIAHEVTGSPGAYGQRVGPDLIAFVRLCAHYFGNGAWLSDDQLVDGAHLLRDIPAELVHGRRDLSCPPSTAWRLARAWPGANLRLVDDAGHTGSPAFAAAMRAAVHRFTAVGRY